MAHWTDYSLRGWLSFLAFMHFGLSMRTLFDGTFLYGKMFLDRPEGQAKEPILLRLYAIHSIGQAVILALAAVHLYIIPWVNFFKFTFAGKVVYQLPSSSRPFSSIQMITIFSLSSFIAFVLLESFAFGTLNFYGVTLLPFFMSLVSLLWLIGFHFLWPNPSLVKQEKEKEQLKSIYHDSKRRCNSLKRASQAAYAAPSSTLVFPCNSPPSSEGSTGNKDQGLTVHYLDRQTIVLKNTLAQQMRRRTGKVDAGEWGLSCMQFFQLESVFVSRFNLVVDDDSILVEQFYLWFSIQLLLQIVIENEMKFSMDSRIGLFSFSVFQSIFVFLVRFVQGSNGKPTLSLESTHDSILFVCKQAGFDEFLLPRTRIQI